MRFVTEFELADGNINNARTSIEAKKDSEMRMGFAIGNAFGWEERGETSLAADSPIFLKHKLAIEAFPMDKWVEFKNNLFAHIDFCNGDDRPVNEIRVLEMIKELEFYGTKK